MSSTGHLPLEYEIVSSNKDAYGSEKIIYVGSKLACQNRLKEIKKYNKDYAKACIIRKYTPSKYE